MIYLLLYIIVVSAVSLYLKIALREVTPAQLIVFAAIGMILVMLISIFIWHKGPPPKSSWLMATIVGIGMALGLLLYVLALERLPLGFVLVVSNVYVVIVVVLSTLFLGERFTPLQIVGIVATLLGVSCLLIG